MATLKRWRLLPQPAEPLLLYIPHELFFSERPGRKKRDLGRLSTYLSASVLGSSNRILRLQRASGVVEKRVYSFASAAWSHHLVVHTEERKENQIA